MADMDLVTLETTKEVLRIDFPDDDGMLSLLISSASQAIIRHLKAGAQIFLDSGGNVVPDDVPEFVRLATIMLVGHIYEHPDEDPKGAFGYGQLPLPVTAMLYTLRDPALA